MFKIVYKSSLRKEELSKTVKKGLIEVQLGVENDDFNNAYIAENKINSIHMSLKYFNEAQDCYCDLTRILYDIGEKNEYYDLLIKALKLAQKEKAGIVIHADRKLEYVKNSPNLKEFIKLTKQYSVEWHIENSTRAPGTPNEALFAPIKICHFLNEEAGHECAYPLLDICHWQMVKDYIYCDYQYNLAETLALYNSPKFFIHFNSAAGSGSRKTGGLHGQNYSDNQRLLYQILEEVQQYNPTLILEVWEDDNINKPNAMWLENKIREWEKSKIN